MQEMQRSFMGLPCTASVSEGTSTHTGRQTLTAEAGDGEEGECWRGAPGEGHWRTRRKGEETEKMDHEVSLKIPCTCMYTCTCAPRVCMLTTGKGGGREGMDDPEVTEHLPRSSGMRCSTHLSPALRDISSRWETGHAHLHTLTIHAPLHSANIAKVCSMPGLMLGQATKMNQTLPMP